MLASSQPPEEVLPGVFVRHPTIGDLVEVDERVGKPGFMGWYLVRFMVSADGSPIWAPDEQEKAERVHAAIAQRVIERVGELAKAPPDCGEASGARPRLEIRPAALDGAAAAGVGPDERAETR